MHKQKGHCDSNRMTKLTIRTKNTVIWVKQQIQRSQKYRQITTCVFRISRGKELYVKFLEKEQLYRGTTAVIL
jgi:hypothetical protein